MVVISEKSIEKIILDVAPKVQRLTLWDPNIEGLAIKIIRRDQLWENGEKVAFGHLGISTKVEEEKNKKAIELVEMISSYLTLAQYEPFSETMLVIPDNLRFGTNESGVALTLGHELVHRAQFTNNNGFLELYASLFRGTIGTKAYEHDRFEDKSALKHMQSLMTLAEGDASFVGSQLKAMFYQDAESKNSWLSNILGLLIVLGSKGNNGLSDGFIQKIRQYGRGKKVVQSVYESRGREAVNSLYGSMSANLYGLPNRWKA